MSTTAPVAPLGQALTRRRANPLPAIILAAGLIAAIALAALGFLESRKTEAVIILARDVPYGQQISAEDLGVVELPLHRPAQLAGVSRPAAAIGQYAARNLGASDLLQPAMLIAEPPGQPVYPNGEQLTLNMVPLPFATATVGPISYRDRLNIGFSDPSGAPDLCDQARSAAGGAPSVAPSVISAQARPYACRLLGSVRVLYVDEGAGVAYLELTPYQAHTIWALQAAGLQLWGERYGAESLPLDALDRLDIGQVTISDLEAPVPAEGIPGAGGAIPGSEQP
ncbi:SAF domain-containing protein [Chloroflexales bacterium ZM16-3]|nr:SAF domain-containing protein [Chloroflexales bacterium ZM16-3]